MQLFKLVEIMEFITIVGSELSSVHSQKGICITHKMKTVLKIRSFLSKKSGWWRQKVSLLSFIFSFAVGDLVGIQQLA